MDVLVKDIIWPAPSAELTASREETNTLLCDCLLRKVSAA